MKNTNNTQITEKDAKKIVEDMISIEVLDEMFTDALIALETYEFEDAKQTALVIIDNSKFIEQRCGAMMLFHIALLEDKKVTDEFLKTIYKNL